MNGGTVMVSRTLRVLDTLPYCGTEEQVESEFAKASIVNPTDKRDILLRCMGVEEVFNAPEDSVITDQEEYEYELAIFLEGSWRLLAL